MPITVYADDANIDDVETSFQAILTDNTVTRSAFTNATFMRTENNIKITVV